MNISKLKDLRKILVRAEGFSGYDSDDPGFANYSDLVDLIDAILDDKESEE